MRAVAKLRIGRSLWLNRVSGGLGRVRPALRGELGADVAVVGAGITGASVAWRFADAGLRVALVEAARVGRGSTAASTALLQFEIDTPLIRLADQVGMERASRAWLRCFHAVDDLASLVRRLGIPCDFRQRGALYLAGETLSAVGRS